jgi:hypothetical protein
MNEGGWLKPKFLNVEKGGREGRTSPSWPNTNPCQPWKASVFAADGLLVSL